MRVNPPKRQTTTKRATAAHRREGGHLLIAFGPWLTAGAFVAVSAMVAAQAGWQADAMWVLAVTLLTGVMLCAMLLFYRQTMNQRAAVTALHEAQARVGGIVESAMDAIITVDEDQRIVLFNAAAEQVFRWPRNSVLGEPLDMLLPERLRRNHRSHIESFAVKGVTSRRMGDKTVLQGLRRDGEEFPLDASISQHIENGRKLFTVILRDVTERVRAEHALLESKQELRELASAAHTVREQEKSRIARELHDELAQSLTSVKMDLSAAREDLPTSQQQLSAKLEGMQNMIDDMVTATRRIAADLRPLMLDDLGLVPAAEWLAQNFTARTGIHCNFSVDPPELQLSDPYATAIFRILQESLTNIARHAHASLVEITLDGNGGEIILRVRDNGCGFDPTAPRKPASFGLVGLRERVTLLGGGISIDSAPGRGSVIEIQIPLQQAAAA